MFIDTHAHLDMTDFDKDRDSTIQRAINAGLSHILTVGIDLKSSTSASMLASSHDMIFAAIGYHPHHAGDCNPDCLDALVRMASKPDVVAWGEIGLDFFRHYASSTDQATWFSHQLAIAQELKLPVIIHDRDAHKQVYSMLKRMGKGKRKGVIHCFSGDMDLAEAFIELGYYISIPGTVTYKTATPVIQVASRIPLGHMLIETDAPFLAPVPKRGKRNEPAFVVFTAKEIARLRNMDVEEVGRRTSENAKTLFRLP